MAFRDILKKQRQSGKGLISSIASASNKSMLESIDPRNKIFKKGSLLNSLFPNVKGYKAEGEKTVSSALVPQQTPSVVNTEMLAKLDALGDKMDVVGKNTMVMPLMMRDSNIMRQSLVKLVKLSGGTQRDKADRFFQTAKDRESLYESQFKKSVSTTPTSPTPADKKTESGGGFLDMLLKGLLVGGVLAGIGKLMEDPAIRAIVKEYVQGFVTSVFDGLKFILSTIMETEIDIAGFKMSLGAAIAGTIAAFVGFKLAIAALAAYITGKIGGASIRSPGIPDGPDRGKPSGKTPVPGPGAPGTPGKTEEKPKPTGNKPERYRDPKTGRFAKMPKPGMAPTGGVGRAIGIAALLGLAVELVYTSDSDIAILRDDGFSKSKVFDKLTEEEQDDYLEKVYRKDFKESDLKAEREALMKKYNLEATGTMLRWKEKYVEKATPPSVTPAGGGDTGEVPGVTTQSGAVPAPAASTRVSQGTVTSTPDPKTPTKATKSTPSKLPTNSVTPGDIDPSRTTFNDLTREQQDIFMQNQREAEGFKPGSLTYDLNNPGAMLYSPWQKKYGAELDTTGRGVGTVKGLFAKFPTLEDGVEAQRALLSGKKYGDLPLEQAINQWVTGNKFSDVDTNMGGQTNTGYKNKIYAALGAPPATSTGMPTTVASAPSSPATVAAAPSRPATQIASASTSLADTMRSQMQTPVVVNAPQTVNNMQQGSQAVTQYTAPSIVDSEFMRMLVSRAV
jgi:hypothetical protein